MAHEEEDLDGSIDAHHHTLGIRQNQSSPGPHIHDGTDSVKLLTGVTLTGAKAGNTALTSIIAVLVQLGATDGTT